MGDATTHKILMLRSPLGVFGAERVILELAQGLHETRFTPIIGVIANKSGGHREMAKASQELQFQTETFDSALPFDWKTVVQIRNYIRNNDIHIVHTHGYKANFYGLMATRFTQVPTIATCHPWTETDYSVKARLYTFLDKRWLKKMHRIIAISEEVRQKLPMRESVAVIPNGIDLSRFNGRHQDDMLRQQLGFSSSDIIIGTIGRLVPEKGYRYLLDSMHELCKTHHNIALIIVGDGPLVHQLKQQVKERKLESRVSFLGIRNDTPELLAIMDIFVMPSLSEGLPMALLEAMAAGKPVVATAVGAIPQIIRDGDSGMLVPPQDIERLTTTLARLIQAPQKTQQIGEKARKEVETNYSSARMTQRYIEHYRQLLN